MSVLRRGITGFWNSDDASPPNCDLALFRRHCFAVARSAGGSVCEENRNPWQTSANFAIEVIDLPDGPIAILLNRHYPLIALAVPPIDAGSLHYVDREDLSDTVQANGHYHLLSRSTLERPVTEQGRQELSPAEIKQLAYWRPSRVGDLIFNFWD